MPPGLPDRLLALDTMTDDGIADDAIAGLNIPTGIPLVYELDADLHPVGDLPLEDRYLGGAAAARAAADAVAKQAG